MKNPITKFSPRDSHTNRQWMAKFFKCGMRCWYCYKPLSLLEGENIEIATKDHQIPRSRGGSDRIDNIVPACFDCNRRKGNMTEEEFRSAVSTAFKNATYDLVKPKREMSLGERDEPSLDRLRKESEGLSWAWRN